MLLPKRIPPIGTAGSVTQSETMGLITNARQPAIIPIQATWRDHCGKDGYVPMNGSHKSWVVSY